MRVEGESDRTLKGISRCATAMTIESSGEKEVCAFFGYKRNCSNSFSSHNFIRLFGLICDKALKNQKKS